MAEFGGKLGGDFFGEVQGEVFREVLVEGAGHFGQQRFEGGDAAFGPGPSGEGFNDQGLAAVDEQTGVVFYLQLSDPGQLFVFHAHYGVYVGFGLTFLGYGACYFAGLGGGVKVG